MKATCIQMDMLFAQPEENFAKAKRLIREAMASGPDVVVLPETWNTGFFPKGVSASPANLKCCKPNGIPIIVMHNNKPKAK